MRQFILTTFIFSLSAAHLLCASEDKLELEGILERRANLPATLHAGYPSCWEVLEKRKAETLLSALQYLPQDLKIRLLELRIGTPGNSRWTAENKSLTTTVPHEEEMSQETRGERRAWSPHCFPANTEIVRYLSKEKSETVTIDQIKAGDSILASPVRMIEDPKYHGPCWDRVTQVHIGKVNRGEPYHALRYGSASSKVEYALNVTSQHPFLVSTDLGKSWEWQHSETLKAGLTLYGINEIGEPRLFQFLDNQKTIYPKIGRLDFVSKTFFSVYTLTTGDTQTFFINKPGAQVLVHNKP